MNTKLRALVVYESMFGNTEQVARAIATGLAAEKADVTIQEVGHAPREQIGDYDVVVAGAPTHAFSLSRPATRADAVRQGAAEDRAAFGLREWLSEVDVTTGTGFAAFDTRVSKVRRLPKAAGPRAAKMARRAGFSLLSKPVAFVVEDVAGPLGPEELGRAERWGCYLAGIARIHVAAEVAGRARVTQT